MTTVPLAHLSMFPAFAGLSNPALAAALEALPAYREHEAAKVRIATALQAASGDLLTATQARLAHVQQVADVAKADKPQPADFATRAAKSAAAVTEAREAVALVQEADRLLAAERDSILSAAPAALSEHLDGQLQDVLQRARGLDLRGATAAQEALDAGTGQAWQEYVKLTAAAADIRAAQRIIHAHLSHASDTAGHLTTFGAVRNYTTLFPRWFDRQRNKPVGVVNGDPVYPAPPWPEDDPAGVWAYAVRHHEVDLWVPTPAQLRDAYTEARAEALRAAALEDRKNAGLNLTPEQRRWEENRALLERQYLTR